MAETLRRARASVRARPTVGVVLLVMVLLGLGGEGVDRLWQFHLFADELDRDSTVLVLATLFLGGLLLGAALTPVVERVVGDDADGAAARRLLAGANLGVGLAVVVLAVGPWGLAATAYCVAQALRHASEPLVTAWVNRGADPSVRATLNSLIGQAESVGEVAGGPALGVVGATAGVPIALVSSGVVFGMAAALARWWRAGAAADGRLEVAVGG